MLPLFNADYFDYLLSYICWVEWVIWIGCLCLLSFLLSLLFSIKINTVFLQVKGNENRPRASSKFLQIPYSRNPVNTWPMKEMMYGRKAWVIGVGGWKDNYFFQYTFSLFLWHNITETSKKQTCTSAQRMKNGQKNKKLKKK